MTAYAASEPFTARLGGDAELQNYAAVHQVMVSRSVDLFAVSHRTTLRYCLRPFRIGERPGSPDPERTFRSHSGDETVLPFTRVVDLVQFSL